MTRCSKARGSSRQAGNIGTPCLRRHGIVRCDCKHGCVIPIVLQKSLQVPFDICHHCHTRCVEKIEGSSRLLPPVRGTLIAIKLSTYDFSFIDELAFLLFSPDRVFDPKVRLTVRSRLISTRTRGAPKIHPGAVEVRRPGEIHSINIVKGHASHVSIWISPFHRSATRRDKIHPKRQRSEAITNEPQIAPRHPAVLESSGVVSRFRSALLRKKFHKLFGSLVVLEKTLGHICFRMWRNNKMRHKSACRQFQRDKFGLKKCWLYRPILSHDSSEPYGSGR